MERNDTNYLVRIIPIYSTIPIVLSIINVMFDIKTGFNHSIAKGISNKVYVWGDSTWGKIGIKQSTADQFDPLEISDMKIRNVINMFAGPMHSGFFTSGDFNLDN